MRSGVGFPSFTTLATWTLAAGTADSSFPVANLADTIRLRRPAGLTQVSSQISLTFNLSLASPLQLAALIQHGLAAGDTVRMRFYSAASLGGTLLADQTFTVPALVTLYPAVLPMVLSAAVVGALSGNLLITTSVATELYIGAVELAGFYQWTNIDMGRSLGFNSKGQRIAQPGGIDANMAQWSPRIMQGTREMVDRSEGDSTFIDFQAQTRLSQPFLWVWDADDNTTWAREAFLVKNKPLANTTVTADPAVKVTFNFEEHLG